MILDYDTLAANERYILIFGHYSFSGELLNVYKHNKPVYGLSIDPRCDSIFATDCRKGRILVFTNVLARTIL